MSSDDTPDRTDGHSLRVSCCMVACTHHTDQGGRCSDTCAEHSPGVWRMHSRTSNLLDDREWHATGGHRSKLWVLDMYKVDIPGRYGKYGQPDDYSCALENT